MYGELNQLKTLTSKTVIAYTKLQYFRNNTAKLSHNSKKLHPAKLYCETGYSFINEFILKYFYSDKIIHHGCLSYF